MMYNESGSCRPCHQECGECSGPRDNQCLTCASDTKVQFNGSCTDVCPKQTPYVNEGECVDSCQNLTHGNHCVDICPKNTFTFKKLCVNSCPPSHPYSTKDFHCVVQCEKYSYQNSCVEHCPRAPMNVSKNGTCIADNTSDHFCPYNTYMERNRTCVKCHASCNGCHGPGREYCDQCMFMLESHCVEKCPATAPYLDRTSATPHCLSQCNGTLSFLDAETNDCIHNCRDKLEYNRTCFNKCPGDMVKSRQENKCAKHCLYDERVFNSTCVWQCPQSQKYVLNKTCFIRCPNGYFNFANSDSWSNPRDEITCVASCPNGYAIYNKSCVNSCPNSHPAIHNDVCVKNCPYNYVKWYSHPVDIDEQSLQHSNYHCVQECLHGYMLNPETSKCVYECPVNYPLVYNQTCVKDCPDDTFVNKRPFQTHTNPSEVVVSECIESCSSGEKTFHKTCVNSACPSGFDSMKSSDVNETCIFSCPSSGTDQHVICYSKCQSGKVHDLHQIKDTLSCHSLCTDGKYTDLRSGSYSCTSYCKGCMYNKLCLNKCPSFSPFVNTSRTCMESCPPNLYLNESQYNDFVNIFLKHRGDKVSSETESFHETPVFNCINYCPYFIINTSDTKICITECPEEFPYVQDRFCVQHIPVTLLQVLLYLLTFVLYLPIMGHCFYRRKVKTKLRHRRERMQITKLDLTTVKPLCWSQ